MQKAILRLTLSGAISAVIPAVCASIPHLNNTTAALIMILYVLGISIKWGWLGALTAAIAGGISYDYYFLEPPGFALTAAEDGVSLAAFVTTAIVIGRLATQLKERRLETVEQHVELGKLYRLATGLLKNDSLPLVAAHLAEIIGADGVVLYDKHSGSIVRSGPGSAGVSARKLLEAASSGHHRFYPGSRLCLTSIQDEAETAGSIALTGVRLSESLLSAVSVNVGLALARLRAKEATTEAEAARRLDELKSAILDTMAHEIRNPLHSIKIAATTLLSEHSGSQMFTRDMLSVIDQEVTRLGRSLDNAVEMARVEPNELPLNKERQNLTGLISAAIEEMSTLAGSRVIEKVVPESLPAVVCDKDMVIRVLKQLLGNALKYSPDDSPITVSVTFTEEAIVIDVLDCGTGVSDDERDRIFEKYYRGRAARSGIRGSGLGLAGAKAIVQAHGGEIWATRRQHGGAAFHVSLPVAESKMQLGVA